ncbi:NAD-dependent epimerase/dehydratase [Catenulispora acidiphila DSM 44928]|uniref:NAD-dependent epimerase/dehydratase n=1 Tax=Catenulispora acidiphila (strain DSM 44928 / JCM 14897 / NBRC 102108 / NRRL B-24433 / ID139908) TaxID=479433 RepID=C7Q6H8_CATAD|nr:NAD(P)-dependent oxidoreductase [Catenulispora acidiphila]ACU74013.1 NAD-dependent epimerase/dehydratase [Catenulispora acidiphila DSM 44928]
MPEDVSESAGRRMLITGAAGGVGTFLRTGLAALGWQLRCLDLRMPDDPGGAEWIVGDISDAATLDAAMAGIDVVIHLAAIPIEDHFDAILHANIDGTYRVFDAAARAGVPRFLFASSNHAVGYYERSSLGNGRIPADARTRPDTFYGVSKVFGEAIGSFYHDRHGLQVACVRIGACYAEPKTRRMLDTWFSPGDAVRLFHTLATTPDLGYEIVYGVSANRTAWGNLDSARRLGYEPQDDSSAFADRFANQPIDPDDPEVRYLGGDFTTATPGPR